MFDDGHDVNVNLERGHNRVKWMTGSRDGDASQPQLQKRSTFFFVIYLFTLFVY